MTSPIEAVIFDWGGVIMQTQERTGREFWDHKLKLPAGTVESTVHGAPVWIQAQLGEISPSDYWQEIARRLQVPDHMLPELQFDFYRGDQLNHSTIDIIRGLRAQHYKTALLSNFSVELNYLLDAFFLRGFFDVIVISAEIGVTKPDSQAYITTLDRMRVAAENSVFIDDSAENIRGAAALGIHGIHHTESCDLREELLQAGVAL